MGLYKQPGQAGKQPNFSFQARERKDLVPAAVNSQSNSSWDSVFQFARDSAWKRVIFAHLFNSKRSTESMSGLSLNNNTGIQGQYLLAHLLSSIVFRSG